jgi:hypothetical protein
MSMPGPHQAGGYQATAAYAGPADMRLPAASAVHRKVPRAKHFRAAELRRVFARR